MTSFFVYWLADCSHIYLCAFLIVSATSCQRSVCLPIYLPSCLSICRLACCLLSACISIRLSTFSRLSQLAAVCVFVYLTVCPCLSVCLSACLHVCLSFCLFIYRLSICLSVCLSASLQSCILSVYLSLCVFFESLLL